MGTNTTLTEIPLGDRENRRQSVIIIPALNVANSPGVLDLQTVSGTTVADVYLWANSTGSALRYSTTFPTSIDSDGTALGTSSFDERVTITLADNTGPALAITNPDTTGNTNAATITPSGSGYGLYIAPQEADTMGLGFVAAAASTVPYIKLDGVTGTGYVGAENIGLLHITNDGSLAHANASLFYIANAGIPANDSRGHCLRIVDTGNAAAGTMGYPVYISSNDATIGGVYITTAATCAALTVAAGTASFAGVTTFSAGLKTKVSAADVTNPPTDAEAISAFGAAATTGAGFVAILDDGGSHANEYLIISDGTKYWQVTMTACA